MGSRVFCKRCNQALYLEWRAHGLRVWAAFYADARPVEDCPTCGQALSPEVVALERVNPLTVAGGGER